MLQMVNEDDLILSLEDESYSFKKRRIPGSTWFDSGIVATDQIQRIIDMAELDALLIGPASIVLINQSSSSSFVNSQISAVFLEIGLQLFTKNGEEIWRHTEKFSTTTVKNSEMIVMSTPAPDPMLLVKQNGPRLLELAADYFHNVFPYHDGRKPSPVPKPGKLPLIITISPPPPNK